MAQERMRPRDSFCGIESSRARRDSVRGQRSLRGL
jgi:hypothetical protein